MMRCVAMKKIKHTPIDWSVLGGTPVTNMEGENPNNSYMDVAISSEFDREIAPKEVLELLKSNDKGICIDGLI